MAVGKVILIPTVLHEEADNTIPAYVIEQAKLCDAFFVENEKTNVLSRFQQNGKNVFQT